MSFTICNLPLPHSPLSKTTWPMPLSTYWNILPSLPLKFKRKLIR
jgi:hypothetical protein